MNAIKPFKHQSFRQIKQASAQVFCQSNL